MAVQTLAASAGAEPAAAASDPSAPPSTTEPPSSQGTDEAATTTDAGDAEEEGRGQPPAAESIDVVIQEGVDAAGAGGLVLVAAGSYVENVVIMGSPRRIVGRCPDMVEIVGSAVAEAAVQIRSGSSGRVGGSGRPAAGRALSYVLLQ